MRRATPLLLCLLLTACSSGSAKVVANSTPSPTVSPTPSPTPSTSATPSPTPAVVPTTAKPTPSPTTAGKAILVLEPDGLGYLTGSSSIRHLSFAATSADDITSVVDTIRGPGTFAPLPECGQGARSSYTAKGLQLLFDDKKWVGWSLDGKPPVVSTVDGERIGMTWTALKKLRPKVMRNNESLGYEFFESDATINGFLDGGTDASKVTLLYAGESCFAR